MESQDNRFDTLSESDHVLDSVAYSSQEIDRRIRVPIPPEPGNRVREMLNNMAERLAEQDNVDSLRSAATWNVARGTVQQSPAAAQSLMNSLVREVTDDEIFRTRIMGEFPEPRPTVAISRAELRRQYEPAPIPDLTDEEFARLNEGDQEPSISELAQRISEAQVALGNDNLNLSPIIPAAPPVPTTREYLVQFFGIFHGINIDTPELVAFIDSLPLDDKIAAKEMIVNYQPPVIENEEDLIDLPEVEGNHPPAIRQLIDDLRYHENEAEMFRERIRNEYRTSSTPQISINRIKEDFSDFWEASITGNLELKLVSKFDCKLSHSFKEKADQPERTILVNLGKFEFTYRMGDMQFIRCKPLNYSLNGFVTSPHPHVNGYVCWGTQDELAKDAIFRRDFKAFSRLLFQAITNYNHASTFCSLLRYKLQLGDFQGETFVYRASSSYRTLRLTDLPKGIHLASISSCNEATAYVLRYRRYMPYLNHYMSEFYFKVSKSIDESGFVKDERNVDTNVPLYKLVDGDDIARIISKRGDATGLDF